MATWAVTLPIAGHAILEVEADTEEAAITSAMEAVTIDDIETWEAVKHFQQGNISCCPHPWSAEAEEVEEG